MAMICIDWQRRATPVWGLYSAFDNDPGRTRTCNPRLRRPMPYPLGHGAYVYV